MKKILLLLCALVLFFGAAGTVGAVGTLCQDSVTTCTAPDICNSNGNGCIAPGPTGACCQAGGICAVVTNLQCNGFGGGATWMTGQTCSPNPCTNNTNSGNCTVDTLADDCPLTPQQLAANQVVSCISGHCVYGTQGNLGNNGTACTSNTACSSGHCCLFSTDTCVSGPPVTPTVTGTSNTGLCVASGGAPTSDNSCTPACSVGQNCVNGTCVSAPAGFSINLMNPLCPTGSQGTCSATNCDGNLWSTVDAGIPQYPFSSFQACCTFFNAPVDGTGSCVSDFPGLIRAITTFISGLIASIAVLVIIWAGFLYLTSAGNPSKIDAAKKALIYAVVGIAISLAGAGLVTVITAVIGPAPSGTTTSGGGGDGSGSSGSGSSW